MLLLYSPLNSYLYVHWTLNKYYYCKFVFVMIFIFLFSDSSEDESTTKVTPSHTTPPSAVPSTSRDGPRTWCSSRSSRRVPALVLSSSDSDGEVHQPKHVR